MDPRIVPLFRLADSIASMRLRWEAATGSDLEGPILGCLTNMIWDLDGLIDDTEGIMETMPWWEAWKERAG
jgi:hypothetical protein